MLTVEETKKYIRLAKNGDNNAKEILLENNISLIKSLVKRFINKGVESDDLFQIGSIGFLKAIENYDESFETRFSTYAVPMIIGEIKRFLRDDGSIKISRIIKSQAIKINRFIEEYNQINGNKPTINEISEKLEIPNDEVAVALESSHQLISLYECSDDGNEKSIELIEKISNGYEEETLVDKIMLNTLIESLPERERQLIILRFFKDKTQCETAKDLGVSQVQVSRMETKIINNLKRKI